MFKSTPKQQAASRANAQKSTGPRTAAGKAVSRFNALKHGIYAVHQIMFDEKPGDLAELTAEYHELYAPADSHERFLVDAMVHNEWRLRRIRRVEAELWQSAYNLFIVKNIDATSTCTSGDAFATDSSTFERLQRVANSCERAYHRAHKELMAGIEDLRNPQPAAEPPAETQSAPQPEPCKPASTPSASFHANPKTPPPAAPQPPVVGPDSAPFGSPAAPSDPAETLGTPQEAMDAAPQAIFKESATDL
jgi:hypothetical protein